MAVVGRALAARTEPGGGRRGSPRALAEDLAEFVRAMRAVGLPGAPVAHRGGPLAALDAETRKALAVLGRDPEEGVDAAALTALWDEAQSLPGPSGPPVWLHADLMPGNLLVDGAGRLSGVIDFGCLGAGDPACDLFPAWNLLPAEARPVFREALGVDEGTWLRGRARTLSQAVIALPYYRRGRNEAMAANARHVLREVLAER